MAPSHGALAGLLANGYDLSPYFNSFDDADTVDATEETTFGPLGTPVIAKSYIAGQEAGTVNASGKYVKDVTVGQTAPEVADVLEAAIRGAKDNVVYLPWGDGFGLSCSGMNADLTKYNVVSPVSGIITVDASFESSTGIEPLSVLHPLATDATGTILGTDLDAGAGYTAANYKGIVAYLHCTAITGTPNAVVKVQHSVDGTTWVDLVTFTNVTAKHTAQRIKVLGTVNRHLRTNVVVAAASTATVHIAAGRTV